MKLTAHIKTGAGKLVKQEVYIASTVDEWKTTLTRAGADGYTSYTNQGPSNVTIMIRTADVAMWVVEP